MSDLSFHIVEDRTELEGKPDWAEYLVQKNLAKRDHRVIVNFCGIATKKNSVLIALPRNYFTNQKLPKKAPEQYGAAIFSALKRYSSSSASQTVMDGTQADDSVNLGILGRIDWFLNDYVNNGIYTARAKIQTINKGQIDWPRTFHKESPVPGLAGTPVYLDLHSRKVRQSALNEISLIHAGIIRELDTRFSWLLTGDSKVRVGAELESYPPSILDKRAAIYLIRRELQTIYSDREAHLLTAMLDYFAKKEVEMDDDLSIGIRSGEYLWEEMLRKTLPDVIKVNHILPRPIYINKGTGKRFNSKGMQTDFVVQRESDLAVIDAKYYSAKAVEGAPGWPDLVKQFFYEKALRVIFPESKIFNWFAFPGDYGGLNDGPLTRGAVLERRSNDILDDEFPPISCSYFPVEKVLDLYSKNRKFGRTELDLLFSS